MKRFCWLTCPRSHGRICANVARRWLSSSDWYLGAAEGLRIAALFFVSRLDILRGLSISSSVSS